MTDCPHNRGKFGHRYMPERTSQSFQGRVKGGESPSVVIPKMTGKPLDKTRHRADFSS